MVEPKQKNIGWTQHPLVDMGIASLLAFSGHDDPTQLDLDELEAFAKYAEKAYFSPELSSYLTVLFTSNFLNPSFSDEKKKQFLSGLLRSFNSPTDSSLPKCTYCKKDSVRLAHRDLVPMLSGRDAANFYPGGSPGVPICGTCILALQALTIGAPFCSGRALVVACDDPNSILYLVRIWQPEIRKRVQLSEQSGQKLPPISRPLTRTVEALVQIANELHGSRSAILVFHLSNSGQGPQADLYTLPSVAISFLLRAQGAKHSGTWQNIVRRAWETPPLKKGEKEARSLDPFSTRNYLYEDLFYLPQRAARFIRTYFLRRPTSFGQGPGDPRVNYTAWQDQAAGIWDITSLFLQEVMSVDAGRIEAVKKLAQSLADEISGEKDRRLWWSVYSAENYRAIRLALLQVDRKRVMRGAPPLLSLDDFLNVFEEAEDLPKIDWRLAWDLVLIGMIEKLHEKQWFKENQRTLEDEEKQLEAKEA